MVLEWIRCNKCFISLQSMKVGFTPFSLTQCGHIFCKQCMQKVINTTECLECKTTNVQSLQLTESLPVTVKHIFEPILDVCERMVLASKFQSTQMAILHKRSETMEKKYYGLKMAYMKMYKQFEEMKINYTRIANERRAGYTPQNISLSDAQRKYFDTPMFIQSTEAKRPTSSNFQQLSQRNYHMGYQSDDNYLTDSSHTSSSTVRVAHQNNQLTPDGIFRIPHIKKLPRSTGTASSHSSSGISSLDNSMQSRGRIF